MTAWILGVVGMVLIVTLAEIIVPEGETAKYVKGVISLMIVYIIVLPIPTLLSTKIDINSFFDFSSESYEIDSDFIQIIKEDKQCALSDSLKSVFRDSGLTTPSALVVLGESGDIACVMLSGSEEELPQAFDITLAFLNVKEDKVVINEIYT